MAGSMRNAMRRLGLAPADEPDDYADYYEPEEPQLADVTPINRGGNSHGVPLMQQVGQMRRIVTARPRHFREGKSVGSPYREGVPVIMNLSDVVDPADAQRLVDFAGGLTYAMQGRIERVHEQVFLLSPPSVEVSRVEPAAARRDYDGE